jgi:geranylgeranyl pyrophosphate synthase
VKVSNGSAYGSISIDDLDMKRMDDPISAPVALDDPASVRPDSHQTKSGASLGARAMTDPQEHAASFTEDTVRDAVASICRPVQAQMIDLELKLDRLIEEAPADLADKLAHTLKGGGKRIRPALVLLAGNLYPGRADPLVSMAVGYELLHTATLVHDDTIDNAVTRRGRLTANRLWGNHSAVVMGDYLCGCSALMTAQTGNLHAMEIFSQALADICGGAIGEHVAGSKKCREEYFMTIRRKTASLFSAATESGAVLSKAPKRAVRALRTYGYNLGMAFQTVDDIHDFASDVSQGSITLPAILVLEQSQNRWVADVLDKDPPTGLDILIEMVEDSCVLDDCHRIAQGFCAEACSTLEILPHSSIRDSLRDLVEYVVDRNPT